MFRLAHTFMRLRRFGQAQLLADQAIETLRLRVNDRTLEALSLYGAMHLVVAALAGFENDRPKARAALDEAERIAGRVGEGRNDYDTEFGPINVQIHRVSIAVDLADAGEAIELAQAIDSSELSPERQMRLHLDTARAHIQRRQLGQKSSRRCDLMTVRSSSQQVGAQPDTARSRADGNRAVG